MDICESCGMPLEEDTTSKHNDLYCIYCQDQETGEMATYEQVKEGSIKAAMDIMGKTEKEAREMADEMLPHLPRWHNEKIARMKEKKEKGRES